MFAKADRPTNLCHQILQREANTNRNPKAFAANLFRERLRIAKNLFKTDLRGHYGCVNAIEFSHGGKFLASGGDDKRVLVWDVEKSLAGTSTPRALATEQASNIFCLGFDSKNRKLISGGNDTLAISHDFETGKLDNVFKHDGPVYGLSIDPQNDHIFSTASENGEILLFDQRTTVPTVIASVPSSFHAVEFHPTMGNLLVTANSKRGATLYDIRKPKQPVILYGNLGNPRSCMSVRFNRTGKLILGLRRRLPPILYDVNSPEPICTFYHSNYYNSCTMKSCTFAGEDDEMVVSGSDDFNLYVWRLSDIDLEGTEQWVESAQMVLYGHRSIVNQVRYNRQKCLLASSGVEKIIKIWSPFSQQNWTGCLTEEASGSDNPRELYSPYNLFTMALPENWHHLSHDYSSENTNEDPRMMAFFDSLIQQEIEEWETNSSTDVSQEEDCSISSFFSCGSSSSSSSSDSSTSSSSSSSSSSSDSDSDNENNTNQAKGRKRSKRQAVIRKKAQRKQHNKKTKLAKIKLNQLQKPTNRIAYLIAKKRNTLRRLAIKGASLNNRRSNKLAVVVNGRKRSTNSKQNHRQRSLRRRQGRQTRSSNTLNSEKPTTSAAAAKALAANSRSQQRVQKKKPKVKSDSNDSSEEEEDSGNFAISSSSRSNAANTSSSSNNNNNNNVNVPSTSTGITSNFRDAFLRLSRQIFMSDSEDEDDLEGDDSNKVNNNSNTDSRNETSQDIKPNGINKSTSAKSNNSNTTKESRTNSSTTSRSLRSNQRPRNSAAINVISNTNETILPQRNHPTNNEIFLNNINNNNNSNDGNDHAEHKKNKKSHNGERISPLSVNAAGIGSSCSNKIHKKRRCNDSVLSDDLPTSSRNSNNRYSNELFEEHPTTTTTNTSLSNSSSSLRDASPKSQTQQSPVKRRKMSISDYIKVRSNNDEDEDEFNNNETNNNDIFAMDNVNMNISNNNNNNNNIHNGHLTPQRPNLNNRDVNSYDYNQLSMSQHNNSNNNSYLFTPDSGVSLNNSTTPSTIDHNDIQASTSTTTRIVSYLSPCYEHNDCDVKKVEDHEDENNDDDEGVIVINNRKTNLNQFQQKVARVRRNYRKQFFDDTESD